jgi:hypothetical protein
MINIYIYIYILNNEDKLNNERNAMMDPYISIGDNNLFKFPRELGPKPTLESLYVKKIIQGQPSA